MKNSSTALLGLLSICGLLVGCCTTEKPAAAASSSATKWTVLFDGSSTDALRGFKRPDFPDGSWVIENGALKAVGGADRVDLVTREKYSDFELELEWKVSPAGNSGFFYRVSEQGAQVWHTGPEVQVLDDARHADGKDPRTAAGSLYALLAPNEQKKLKPVGEFNHARLLVKGNHAEHWLNGAKVLEYEIGSPNLQELIAESKFKDLPNFMEEPLGYIAFQHHGDDIWFRNIRIRRL